MTQLGIRERVLRPETYKGFRLVRTHGRVYGIPSFLEPDESLHQGRLLTHPATLKAATWEELGALIDGFDGSRYESEIVGSYEGYQLVRHGGALYGVPQSAGPVNLSLPEARRAAGAIGGETFDEIRGRIRATSGAVPVEFAGWLPVFALAGDCGHHPQFGHTATPPPGYRFTHSPPPPPAPRRPSLWGRCRRALLAPAGRIQRGVNAIRSLFSLFRGGPGRPARARWRALVSLVRLFRVLRRQGARVGPAVRFIQSRHLQSQILLANHRGVVFLTSIPFTYGQRPWVVEIEDPTTLFNPFVHNGHTSNVHLAESPYFPMVKALLESDQCKGVLTHMKSTAELVPTLFGSEAVRRKVFYAPLGVEAPQRWQRHAEQEPEYLDLLFINSWNQIPANFYFRGGLDVLEAFAILRERYPQLRLTLRTNLPALDRHYYRILESGWVRVIDRFLSAEEMADLHAGSHIYLLPAARVHIVSLLQAMSYGLAVVASDGWGMEEYLRNEHNGLIVKGRYGKTSWADTQAGMLREDYEPMYTADARVVDGLVEAVSRLVEDRELRRRLGRTARRDVKANYSLERWNRGLKEALDKAL